MKKFEALSNTNIDIEKCVRFFHGTWMNNHEKN